MFSVMPSELPANLAKALSWSMTSVSVWASLNTPCMPSFCIAWFIHALIRVLVFTSSVSYWLASSPTVWARNSSFCTLESYWDTNPFSCSLRDDPDTVARITLSNILRVMLCNSTSVFTAWPRTAWKYSCATVVLSAWAALMPIVSVLGS